VCPVKRYVFAEFFFEGFPFFVQEIAKDNPGTLLDEARDDTCSYPSGAARNDRTRFSSLKLAEGTNRSISGFWNRSGIWASDPDASANPRPKLEAACIAFGLRFCQAALRFPPCYALQIDLWDRSVSAEEKSEKFSLGR
jgi:hypothetical protein